MTVSHYPDRFEYERETLRPMRGGPEPVRPIHAEVALPLSVNISNIPRAGDAERDRAIEHLAEAYARGYIAEGEHYARLTAAQAAQTVRGLEQLVADLPPMPIRRGYRSPSPERKLSAEARWLAQAVALIASFLLAIFPMILLGLNDLLQYAWSMLIGFPAMVGGAICIILTIRWIVSGERG